jgi:asparagine synthase (glutamine-hydrolysing)
MAGGFLIILACGDGGQAPFEAARHLPGFRVGLDRPGILVLALDTLPVERLPDDRGVVIGRVRERGKAAPTAIGRITADFGRAVIGSGGSILPERVWGEYLCVVVERDGASLAVTRDPSGAIPCYALVRNGFVLLGDDLRYFDRLAPAAPVDEDMLRRTLVFRDLRSRRTCLDGVEEILPGETVTVASDGLSRQACWTPARVFGSRSAPENSETAVDIVRRAVRSAVEAQLHEVGRPLVTISGGLDSSIVAACVAARRETIGFSLLFPGPLGDERRYVEPLAGHLALRLITAIPDADAIHLQASAAARLPRPCARSFAQAGDRLLAGLLETEHFDAIFTGNGGDGVFGYLFSAAPLLDRLAVPDARRGALRTLGEIARLHDVTVWEVIGRARRAHRHPAPSWSPDTRFIRDGADVPVPPHPWLDELDAVPPGKRAQIRSLISMHNHFEAVPLADAVPVLSPLASQPVMEACLVVPSWFAVTGGRDRAVARAAFADLLPPEVARRTTKGGPEGLGLALYDRNRSLLRDMLLGGVLRSRGLIDAGAVEAALADERSRIDGSYYRLSLLADAEAWLNVRTVAAAARPIG